MFADQTVEKHWHKISRQGHFLKAICQTISPLNSKIVSIPYTTQEPPGSGTSLLVWCPCHHAPCIKASLDTLPWISLLHHLSTIPKYFNQTKAQVVLQTRHFVFQLSSCRHDRCSVLIALLLFPSTWLIPAQPLRLSSDHFIQSMFSKPSKRNRIKSHFLKSIVSLNPHMNLEVDFIIIPNLLMGKLQLGEVKWTHQKWHS